MSQSGYAIMTTPEKPPYGSPCNRCGECCRAVLCPLGTAMFNMVDGPCPALEAGGCGLVLNPQNYFPVTAFMRGAARLGAAAAVLVGTGVGCDAQVEGEADNPRYRAELRRRSDVLFRSGQVRAAARTWGVDVA